MSVFKISLKYFRRLLLKACIGMFLIIPVIILYRRIFPFSPDTMIKGEDLTILQYYTFSQISRLFNQGIMPFWNPYNFNGHPILANPAGGTLFYPFNVIFLMLPVNYAFAVYEIFHSMLAAVLMFWYERKMRHNVLTACTVAAGFSLSGYMVANIEMGHMESVAAAAWIPLIFGSVRLLFVKFNRNYLWLAVIGLTLQILTGTHIVVMFTLELLFIYWLYQSILDLFKYRRIIIPFKYAAIIFIIGIFSFGLAAYQLFPAAQYARESVRQNGLTYEQSSRGSFSPELFQLFISPFALGNPFTYNPPYMEPWPNMFEHTYFIGITPLLIIFLYLFYRLFLLFRIRQWDRFFGFLILGIIFFVLMALGSNGPLFKLVYDYIPLSRSFRMPTRYMLMVSFLLILTLGEALNHIRKPALKIIIYGLVVLELVIFGGNFIFPEKLPTALNDPVLINYIFDNLGNSRVYPHYLSWWSNRSLLDLNAAAYYEFPSINGYNPMLLKRYNHFVELITGIPTLDSSTSEFPLIDPFSPYIDFLSVKYVISRNGFDDIAEQNTGKYRLIDSSQVLNFYENTKVLPRYFLVHQAVSSPNPEALDKLFLNNIIKPAETVAFTDPELAKIPGFNLKKFNSEKCYSSQNDSVRVNNFAPNRILLQTLSDCASFLSTSDTYYPGWKSRIDGKPAQILIGNVAFRSVYLPAGSHIVEFYYDPQIFYLGIGVSLISILTLIFSLPRIKNLPLLKTPGF